MTDRTGRTVNIARSNTASLARAVRDRIVKVVRVTRCIELAPLYHSLALLSQMLPRTEYGSYKGALCT